MTENLCAAQGCPALCCVNIPIHLSAVEFVNFKKNAPAGYRFIPVEDHNLEEARKSDPDPHDLYFSLHAPDIFSDDSREVFRLFVIACPFLAGNQCTIFGKKYRPQACDSFEFNGTACRIKRTLNV